MGNEKVIAKKQEQVSEVAAKMRDSSSTIIIDYLGLSVAEITELRRELRASGVEMRVLKNNLMRRAADELSMTELKDSLVGPNAALFATDDATAPARIAHNFAKEHDALELKAGIMEGSYVSAEEVQALAALPGREGMYSMLLSVLQAPIRNLAYVTSQIAEEKEA
jgi:large subunit ribosomal protein L10